MLQGDGANGFANCTWRSSLHARQPYTPIALAKRDIAASFRLLLLHPALCLVMITELPGKIFGSDEAADVVLIYLDVPFGRDGPPAHFSVFGGALALLRRARGMSDSQRYGSEPSQSRLYVDDGIFADVIRRQRMNESTDSRGRIARGSSAPTAINQDKLDEEGVWKQQHVILGFNLNASNMTTTLPEAKIIDAPILIEGILQWKGAHILLIKSAQQLRGCVEHFGATSPVWRALAAPVDDPLTFGC